MSNVSPYIAPDYLWRITGGTYDLYVDVPDAIPWQRTWRGRKTDLLCSNRSQVTKRALGLRVGHIGIWIKPHPTQNARAAQIEAMLAQPNTVYTVRQPGEGERTFQVDPAVNLEWRREKGHIIIDVGLIEVIGAAPPVGEAEVFPNDGAVTIYGAPLAVVHGHSMAVSWVNIPEPSVNDILFLQDSAIPGSSFARATRYTGATRNGNGSMFVPGDITIGEYELRLLLDDGTLVAGPLVEVS